MISSKSEMAEWILDFFRRSNCKANEIVMFRGVMNAVSRLNPRERDLFTAVANELISNKYMAFEQQPVQCIRLMSKGEDYIYNPEGVLDCCIDIRKPTEKNFRDIISLGQIVCTLQAHQDILKNGKYAEDFVSMEYPLVQNESLKEMRIGTLKEFYAYLYRFFYLSCQLSSQLDDVTLREVLFHYIDMVKGLLAAEKSIQRAPMVSELSDAYNNAVKSLKTTDEQNSLGTLKSLLFAS